MINPIAEYRTSRKVSRRGMAEVINKSESAIRQVEEGQFINIPPAIHAFFEANLRIDGYSRTQVNQLYREFVLWKRHQVKEGKADFKLKPFVKERILPYINNEHPFYAYLDYIETLPTVFSQQLCIPKSSFFKYLGAQQRAMPHVMRVALHDAGLSFVADIDELDSLGKHFYDNKRGRR